MISTGDPLIDQLVDGLLHDDFERGVTEVTYTFDLPLEIRADLANSRLNQASIDRHLAVFAEVTALTGLTFTEVDGRTQDADLYFTFRENTQTAYVFDYNGGIMHVYNPDRDTPIAGGYVDHLILHEVGHGLGLEHGHDIGALPREYQGFSWSVMSYRAHPETSALTYGTDHGPETYMLADIAAFQFLYGANFETQSDDTLYEVDFDTGEFFINGESQGTPINNKTQRAVWDGGGIDTLDLSNAQDELTVDLQPGAFTSFGDSFLPSSVPGGTLFAEGNLANPFLFEGNTASLLENVIGGRYQDFITGNVMDNTLAGGAGEDALYGLEGDDTLNGGHDNDLIIDGLGNTTAQGNADDDIIAALSGQGTLSGNTGRDVVIGGIDADVLSGGNGDDLIRGEGGRGFLFGNDRINGGSGDDMLMGGRGADQFVFRPDNGDDMIASFTVGDITTIMDRDVSPDGADFEVGVDTIRLIGFSDVNAENVLEFVTDGDDGAIFVAENTSITFFGVSAATLSADDFVF